MLYEEKLYSLKDVCIVPAETTDIQSRSECNCRGDNIEGTVDDFLPLIASPMSCVLSDNFEDYWKNGVSCVIPRTVPFEKRLELKEVVFCAFSMEEGEYILDNDLASGFICLDMANGHMNAQLELGKRLKEAGVEKIMGGNIANPETYIYYDEAGFDYVRVSIGSGNGCFEEGTEILLSNGTLCPIENLKVGDKIINGQGDQDTITELTCLKSNKLICINGNTRCTPNHKFLVIDRCNQSIVNEENIKEYSYWVEAKYLDKTKHLLIKMSNV